MAVNEVQMSLEKVTCKSWVADGRSVFGMAAVCFFFFFLSPSSPPSLPDWSVNKYAGACLDFLLPHSHLWHLHLSQVPMLLYSWTMSPRLLLYQKPSHQRGLHFDRWPKPCSQWAVLCFLCPRIPAQLPGASFRDSKHETLAWAEMFSCFILADGIAKNLPSMTCKGELQNPFTSLFANGCVNGESWISYSVFTFRWYFRWPSLPTSVAHLNTLK